MDLKDIISISGKSGLFKIIGRRPNGLIVEAMDNTKARLPVSFTQKISVMDDIAIYTYSGETRLLEVFVNMMDLGKTVDPKADNDAVKAYFGEILPEYDVNRVYVSDMRKVLSWYLLLKDMFDLRDLLEKQRKEQEEMEKEAAEAEQPEATPEPVAPEAPATEAKPKKTKAAAPKAEEGSAEEKPKKPRAPRKKKTDE